MKIYTKTGDNGKTSLYGGKRVYKDDIRVESYGTVDELISVLGFVRNFIEKKIVIESIIKIQEQLFDITGELATPEWDVYPYKLSQSCIEVLEKDIDSYSKQVEQTRSFTVPGNNKPSAGLHLARTICRRAERRIVQLGRESTINPLLTTYINRLSDLFYIMARYLEDGICE